LENAIERACVVAAGPEIRIEDLPDAIRSRALSDQKSQSKTPFRALEREYIQATLERNHGRRKRTAEELQISLSTLKRRLRFYGQES
jgi:DNA-binding NtrC family response regulator